MNTNSFHNTINLFGEDLAEAEKRAETQDEIILRIFKKFQGVGLTPFMVEDILEQQGHSWPITSIRRSITNLTNEGKLMKSQEAKAKGVYNTLNHRWTLAEKKEAA